MLEIFEKFVFLEIWIDFSAFGALPSYFHHNLISIVEIMLNSIKNSYFNDVCGFFVSSSALRFVGLMCVCFDTCFFDLLFWKKYCNSPDEAVVVLQTRSAWKTVRGSKTGLSGGPDSLPLGMSFF